MYIEQLYTSCLSEAAYYIESNGEAAVIDPLRDTAPYLRLADSRKAKIRYVIETHVHADFVSGHIDLARQTGAEIIYGPGADTRFARRTVQDGESLPLGVCRMEAIHTPGHTPESTCFLLRDESGKPHALFTGDTLFVGDVGRPDLVGGDSEPEDMAAQLYDSLQKLQQLPDDVAVYPAHGPGSACGKHLGPETHSTLGAERQRNYALQAASKEDFVRVVTEGLQAAPSYFAVNARINRQGYISMDDILAVGMRPLSVDELKQFKADGCLLLDSRPATVFTEGFVPDSVSIGLEGRFAEWAGVLLPFHGKIALITEPGKEEETLVRLARVGFDQVVGFLNGGFAAWEEAGEPIDMIIDVEADEMKMDLNYDLRMVVLDVRKELEFEAGHVKGADNLPLGDMADLAKLGRFDELDNIYVHCGGGYRSVIAASLLKRQGIHNLRNVLGGYEAIRAVPGMPIVAAKEVLN